MKNRSPGIPKPLFQSVQSPTLIITSNTLYQVESLWPFWILICEWFLAVAHLVPHLVATLNFSFMSVKTVRVSIWTQLYLRQNWDLKLFLTQEEKNTGALCLIQSLMLPNGLESAICLKPFVFHVENGENSPVACLKTCLTGLNLFIVLEAARVVWLWKSTYSGW